MIRQPEESNPGCRFSFFIRDVGYKKGFRIHGRQTRYDQPA